MDADGTKDGYDLPMTRAVAEAVGVPVVASGGAGHPEHLLPCSTEGRADAALAASIFHYNEYGIPATKAYLAARGVPVRLISLDRVAGLSDRRARHEQPQRAVDDRRWRRPTSSRPDRRHRAGASPAASRRSTSSSAWS